MDQFVQLQIISSQSEGRQKCLFKVSADSVHCLEASSVSDVLDVLFQGQVIRQPYSKILEVMDLFQSGTLQKNEDTDGYGYGYE